MNLIAVALLRADATRSGITDIVQKGQELRLTLAEFDFSAISALVARPEYKGRAFVVPSGDKPVLSLKLAKQADVLYTAQRFVADYGAALTQNSAK